MKIGFITYPRRKIVDEIEWIGRNKFDFVELFFEEDEAVPGKIDIEKVNYTLLKYGLEAIGHTARYFPIGSPMKSLREAAIRELIKYFEVFRKVGVHFVSVHANWPSSLFTTAEGIRFQIETLTSLVQEAKKRSLELLYEPTDELKDNAENIIKILKEVPRLSLLFDIGHANLFGRQPEVMIEKLFKK